MTVRECVILAAGVMEDNFDISPYIHDGVFVICADGGYDNALRFGIQPDLFVGDMDSVQSHPCGCETIRSPAEKDDTDTMLAVKIALSRGFNHLTILGGLGGRLDHMLANIQTLTYCAEHGVSAKLVGDNDSALVLRDEQVTIEACNRYISVFSLTDSCEGVTLKGLRYPLNNATIYNSFPIGVSNEFRADCAVIEVKKGCLLVVLSKQGLY